MLTSDEYLDGIEGPSKAEEEKKSPRDEVAGEVGHFHGEVGNLLYFGEKNLHLNSLCI